MKIFIKIIIIIFSFAIFGTIEFILVANNFATVNTITQNRKQALECIENATQIYEDNSFYDLRFEYESTSNVAENTDYTKLTIDLKYVKSSETEVEFISTTTTESSVSGTVATDSYSLYYKDGILYKNEGETKTQEELSSSDATSEIGLGFLTLYLTPITITFDDTSALISKFCWSWSPFYMGQTYTYTTEDSISTFDVDLVGNLRKFTVTGSTSTYDYSTASYYNGSVSPTLVFPTDLTTYTAV